MKVNIEQVNDVDVLGLISQTKYAGVLGADKTLKQCLLLSGISWMGFIDGKVACVWGLVPPTLMSNRAYLWLLTTDLVDEHQFIFVRHSQRFVEEALKEYDIIVGHCHSKETRSIRWLKWLGAEFSVPEGLRVPFSIRRKSIG